MLTPANRELVASILSFADEELKASKLMLEKDDCHITWFRSCGVIILHDGFRVHTYPSIEDFEADDQE